MNSKYLKTADNFLLRPDRISLCNEVCGNWLQTLSIRIFQVTLSNARDICLPDYILRVEAFRATVKLLFLLSLVWLTETARMFFEYK